MEIIPHPAQNKKPRPLTTTKERCYNTHKGTPLGTSGLARGLKVTHKRNRHRSGWRFPLVSLIVTLIPQIWKVTVIGMTSPPFGWCGQNRLRRSETASQHYSTKSAKMCQESRPVCVSRTGRFFRSKSWGQTFPHRKDLEDFTEFYQMSTTFPQSPLRRSAFGPFQYLGRLPKFYQGHFLMSKSGLFCVLPLKILCFSS